MTLRRVIKKNAKSGLEGKWGKAILIMLIILGVNVLLNILDNSIFHALGYQNIRIDLHTVLQFPQYQVTLLHTSWGEIAISLIFTLIRLCVTAPLMLGAANWLLELTDGHKLPLGSIFWAYDNIAFGRSIWLAITVSVKTFLFSAAVSLIPGFLIGFSFTDTLPQAVKVILLVAGILLALASIPLVLWFSARYFIAELLLCDRYYYTVRQATRLSVEHSKGHRWQIVGFVLSFLPWFLFSCLVIPAFYVIPYFAMATTIFARFLFEDGLMRQQKLDLHDPDRLIVDDLTPENYQNARAAQGIPEAEEQENAAAAPVQESLEPSQPVQEEAPPTSSESSGESDIADL